MLSKKEISRYERHLLLPEIGISGQEKLKGASVLMIGAGGLGCPALLYLAAAGVGRIGIVDDDIVEESNLQRQILYNDSDIAKSKVELTKKKLQQQNPEIQIDAFNERLATSNAIRLISNYDIILDGTDNFPTRYLLNDACFLLKKTLVSGSIFKFEGQVSVFDFRKNHSPTYRCLFPTPPSAAQAPDCSEIGVIGVLPGIIGSLMALETIKLITNTGIVESGRLLLFNALSLAFQTLEFEYNPESLKLMPMNIEEFEKQDYDYFCKANSENFSSNEISSEELSELLRSNEKIQILDVREVYEEPEVGALKDLNIPLWKLEESTHKISIDKKVVVICKTGVRSRKAIELLQTKFNMNNLLNLRGGVTEWLRMKNETVNNGNEKKA